MIQFNLLPDVKLQFIKARNVNRVMTLISVAVIAGSLAILAFMIITVDIVQKTTLRHLNSQIATSSTELKNTKDLDKILTVQNQLSTLTDLHDKKAVSSRLFGYITQVTPAQATISKLSVDFTQNAMTISGHATGLDIVNTFTNTLKQTTFTTADGLTKNEKAFSSVVMSAYARDEKGSSYTITLNFDSKIFSAASNATLNVPSGVTTDPAALFQVNTGSKT